MPETTHTILCVDDEVGILKALNRLLRRAGYRILVAKSGVTGLEILKKEMVNLIISDQKMPTMPGNEFLRLSRKIRPNALRILLTAHADVKVATAAINQGSIYKFILKPWDDAELLEAIKAGLKQQELTLENRRLAARTAQQYKQFKQFSESLQRKVQEKDKLIGVLRRTGGQKGHPDFIDAMVGLLEMRNPEIASHSTRVAAACKQVAEKIGIGREKTEAIEIAAKLHDIGKIGMPETILHKPLAELTPEELDIIRTHPVDVQKALRMLTGLDDVRPIIQSHHENYDGSGYPEGLRGDQIPYGSLIIAVANAYDNMCHSKTFGKQFTPDEAMETLNAGIGKLYAPEVVECYVTALENEVQPESG